MQGVRIKGLSRSQEMQLERMVKDPDFKQFVDLQATYITKPMYDEIKGIYDNLPDYSLAMRDGMSNLRKRTKKKVKHKDYFNVQGMKAKNWIELRHITKRMEQLVESARENNKANWAMVYYENV